MGNNVVTLFHGRNSVIHSQEDFEERSQKLADEIEYRGSTLIRRHSFFAIPQFSTENSATTPNALL